MSEDTRPIVIKRKKKQAGGHHGGAWKLAYADFVTAMMAFFLLMWLLSSIAQSDLQGIADFFQDPARISLSNTPASGDAASILQGGGRDLTRTTGQVSPDGSRRTLKDAKDDEVRAEFERRERGQLNRLREQIESVIDTNQLFRQFRNQLLMETTGDGLRINIVDALNRPMFDTGSDVLQTHSTAILHEIGRILNSVPNRISVSGHTDASPFIGGERGFSNWELSTNRANSARRQLISGGMDEHKILRVVGRASTQLLDRNDPLSPTNRRISILVLTQRAEEAILMEDARLGVEFGDGSDADRIRD